jgi:hypothetical protein
MGFQFINDARASGRSENANEDVRVFQIGSYVDMVDADQRALERYFARDDAAELAFQDFVDA